MGAAVALRNAEGKSMHWTKCANVRGEWLPLKVKHVNKWNIKHVSLLVLFFSSLTINSTTWINKLIIFFPFFFFVLFSFFSLFFLLKKNERNSFFFPFSSLFFPVLATLSAVSLLSIKLVSSVSCRQRCGEGFLRCRAREAGVRLRLHCPEPRRVPARALLSQQRLWEVSADHGTCAHSSRGVACTTFCWASSCSKRLRPRCNECLWRWS